MKNLLPPSLAFVLMGIFLIAMGNSERKLNNMTPVDFNTLTVDNIETRLKQAELIVEGDLWCNYGAFMERYSTLNGVEVGKSQYRYLFPISDTQFMAVEPQNNKMNNDFDKQATETIAYILGESSTEPESVHIKGRIMRLDSDSMGYMQEYLTLLGYSQTEAKSAACAYYIDCKTYNNWWVKSLGGVAFIALGIGMFVHIVRTLIKNKQWFPSYWNFK